MKKLITLLTCYLAIVNITSANNKLTVSKTIGWSNTTQGIINDAEIEVTPQGAYAEIALTFTLGANTSNYQAKDTLEAVLNFNLPANSLIHDSWLWLDNSTIIVADIIEKNRAVAIYENIVKRRRDPSLLVKTGLNSYQLNVFPMTTGYPRKVKIVYSTPFNWQGNNVNVPIPMELFATSQVKPSVTLKVHSGTQFNMPSFTNKNYASYITGGTPSQQILTIPGQGYGTYENFYLSYASQMNNGVLLTNYNTTANEGIYQLVVNPAATGTIIGKNIAFIIDNNYTNSTIIPFEGVKQYIYALLLNELNSSDSFNIFYVGGNGNISSAFATWEPVNSGSISTGISQLSTINSITTAQYEALLKAGIAFTNSRAGAEGIVISQNTAFSSNQTSVNTTYGNIKSYVGTFSNRIHFITNTYSNYFTTAGTLIGNELLFSKLSLASGGNLYKYTGTIASGTPTGYLLDMQNILKDLSFLSGYNTNIYNVDMQLGSGFTFSRFQLNGYERFSLSSPYIETGKYIGTLQAGTQVNLKVQSPTGMLSQTKNLSSINNVGANSKKGWVYNYIRQLSSTSFTNEIIDSSIKNRVLCDYTAFLAVETGDTLKTNVNDNHNLTIKESNPIKSITASCSPNPFTDKVTIEWDMDITAIEIFDFSGRKVRSTSVKKGDRKIQWDGTDNHGIKLSSGLYIITLKSENNPTVILKALKL